MLGTFALTVVGSPNGVRMMDVILAVVEGRLTVYCALLGVAVLFNLQGTLSCARTRTQHVDILVPIRLLWSQWQNPLLKIRINVTRGLVAITNPSGRMNIYRSRTWRRPAAAPTFIF